MATKLPFLQNLVLEYIYSTINEKGTSPSLEEVAKQAGYHPKSKILQNCLRALVSKGFLQWSEEIRGFQIPQEKQSLYEKIIRRQREEDNFAPRVDYLAQLENFDKSTVSNWSEDTSPQLSLFEEENRIGKQMPLLERYVRGIDELISEGIVFRWYDYLQDFPYQLIQQKIQEYKLKKGQKVLDPFCGSGTTLVAAKFLGLDSIGIDANPLMCLVSSVKTTWDLNLKIMKDQIKITIRRLTEGFIRLNEIEVRNDFTSVMPKRELNQWLKPRLQREVAYCKDLIDEIEDLKIRNLFLVAMAKAAFDASYVSLCPGTTFYPNREKEPFYDLFCRKLVQMYQDLKILSSYDSFGHCQIIEGDARQASYYLPQNSIDLIIGSPPYPNDLEYTRQTRLELYLLGFVKNMAEVQSLKRKMIKGSTKLIYKEDNSEKYVQDIEEVIRVSDKIAEALKDKDWGFDYPKMVREYFGDMYLCLQEFRKVLIPDAHCLLVVGDQTYKEIVIPVGKILIEIAEKLGYRDAKIELLRVRRSTTHNIPLPEEIVVLRK